MVRVVLLQELQLVTHWRAQRTPREEPRWPFRGGWALLLAYELAQQVELSDDIVDALFNDVKADLIAGLRGHPDRTEECLDLLMIAKYLERIGDHAVNIAEWVVYAITGLYKGEELK